MTLPSFRHSATIRTPQCHWNPGVQMAHIALRAEEEVSEFSLVRNLSWCMGFIMQLGWRAITTASGASWVLVLGQALCRMCLMGECSFHPYGGCFEQVSFDFLFMNEETWLFPRSQSCQVAKLKLGCGQVHTQPLHQWAHDTLSSITRTNWIESINKTWRHRLYWSGWAGGSTFFCPSSLGKTIAEHCPCLKTSGSPHSGVLQPPSADA